MRNQYVEDCRAESTPERLDNGLWWFQQSGLGWLPVHEQDEKRDYFQEYRRLYDTSPIAEALNAFRVDLVKQHTLGKVLDIGIGSGAFLKAHGNGWGYDVDQKGIAWLATRERFMCPYDTTLTRCGIEAVTFWDVLEHIQHPGVLLDRIGLQWVFVSIPIFRDSQHILTSKHFKPLEHYWYFTHDGFRQFMEYHQFEIKGHNTEEAQLGRDSVETFACRRIQEAGE